MVAARSVKSFSASSERPIYEVKWFDMPEKMSSSFYNFLKHKNFTDCTLSAEGKFIQAHRVVLASSSHYFKVISITPNQSLGNKSIFLLRNYSPVVQRIKIQSFTSTE